MRKGYLLTALAAAVLLAASSGTAYAQRVTIGFVETSGEVSEEAYVDANSNSLEAAQRITVRVQGLLPGARRIGATGDVMRSLGTSVTITPNKYASFGRVDANGGVTDIEDIATGAPFSLAAGEDGGVFSHDDEIVLVVTQRQAAGDNAAADGNWLAEKIELKLASSAQLPQLRSARMSTRSRLSNLTRRPWRNSGSPISLCRNKVQGLCRWTSLQGHRRLILFPLLLLLPMVRSPTRMISSVSG